MNLPTPKNQSALVVYLLIQYKQTGFSMKEACAVLFYKLQSRMGELERSLDSKGVPRAAKLKIRRLPMKGKNKFGHSMVFMSYKSLAPTPYLLNLLKLLNKQGLK